MWRNRNRSFEESLEINHLSDVKCKKEKKLNKNNQLNTKFDRERKFFQQNPKEKFKMEMRYLPSFETAWPL